LRLKKDINIYTNMLILYIKRCMVIPTIHKCIAGYILFYQQELTEILF
jgi:hypothetical protein